MERKIKDCHCVLPVSMFILAMVFIPTKDVRSSEAEGEQIYVQNCLLCHGDDGRGAMPGVPDLYENRNWLAMPAQQLLLRIKKGIQTAGAPVPMPPKGGNSELTDVELMAVIVYMRDGLLN